MDNRGLAVMSGSPEHIPDDKTRAEVSALCAYGVPQEEISVYIGIDAKTLRKHYRGELDAAKIKANAKVRRFLFEAATGDAMTKGATFSDCLRGSMFWAKTQMGFREGDEETRSEPITINIVKPDGAS